MRGFIPWLRLTLLPTYLLVRGVEKPEVEEQVGWVSLGES
jgi:hypothetical protein